MESKMNKKLVIGIVLAIIVIAVAIGTVVMINSNNNDNQNIAKANNENVNNEVENMNNEDNNIPNEENTTNTDNNTQASNNGKTLVAYFSLPENTGTAREDSTVTVNGERLGNTQYVANLIQEHTGANVNGDAFKLHRNSMEDAPEEVETWLKQIDIID